VTCDVHVGGEKKESQEEDCIHGATERLASLRAELPSEHGI